MTQVQADKIGQFINNLPEDVVDSFVEEITAGISIYFGILLFGEELDKKYEVLKNEGKSLKEIAKEVKKVKIGEEEVHAAIVNSLQDEANAELFAEDCVQSISFCPEIPKVILEELDKLEIDVDDFLMNIIVALKDELITFFINELDVAEWKGDIIDALVASWA